MARQEHRKHRPVDARQSAFDILTRRLGRFMATFFILWALLAAVLSYARILVAENQPLDAPEIVIIVILSVAITAGIAFPLAVGIVEGLPMVLAKLHTDRVRAEAHAEGVAEGETKGAQKMLTRWREWNRRRQAAQQAGQPFTEPEPDLD